MGLTRSSLDGLATEMQRTTVIGDDLVKEAEAILLTFDKVRGEGFERTIKVAADLSARLGTDLKTAVRQVGLALQDPTTGLIALRRSGIAFSESQKDLIKKLVDTGQAAKAQQIILGELERRFAGSAAAARNTLGGALAGLKNQIGDLFEGGGGTGGLASGINNITKALSDPGIKQGMDSLVAGFTAIAAALASIVAVAGPVIAFIGRAIQQAGDLGLIIDNKLFGRQLDESAFARLHGVSPRGTGPGRRYSRGSGIEDRPDAPPEIEEVRVSAQRLSDGYGDVMREIEESTRTAVERTSAEYTKLKTNLQFLLDEGLISKGTYDRRLGDALDEILPEIDLNEIRAKYKTLKKETTELGEFMKGVWQEVGRSIQSTISDALYEWKFSWKSLLNIARRALADITSAIITSGIKNALKSVTSGSSSSTTGSFLKAVGSYFGFAAGGGRVDRPTIVGESGREVVMPPGKVMNQRQMAFAGGGGVTYAPSFSVSIIEKDDAEKTKAEVLQTMAVMLAQDKAEFVRTLSRSGYEVRG